MVCRGVCVDFFSVCVCPLRTQIKVNCAVDLFALEDSMKNFWPIGISSPS